jgi:ribose transport system permease protein
MGLKEKTNAWICYCIAGVLVAVGSFLRISYNGMQSPQLNLSTSSVIFSAMLPIFIGMLVGKFCESNLALVVGCFTAAVITQGLSSLGVSNQVMSLTNAFLMMGLLIYAINQQKAKEILNTVSKFIKKRSTT